jgi:hypothetical protein
VAYRAAIAADPGLFRRIMWTHMRILGTHWGCRVISQVRCALAIKQRRSAFGGTWILPRCASARRRKQPAAAQKENELEGAEKELAFSRKEAAAEKAIAELLLEEDEGGRAGAAGGGRWGRGRREERQRKDGQDGAQCTQQRLRPGPGRAGRLIVAGRTSRYSLAGEAAVVVRGCIALPFSGCAAAQQGAPPPLRGRALVRGRCPRAQLVEARCEVEVLQGKWRGIWPQYHAREGGAGRGREPAAGIRGAAAGEDGGRRTREMDSVAEAVRCTYTS